MKIRTILEHVYKLIERKKNWTKDIEARDSDGNGVSPCGPLAVCFCLDVALARVCGGDMGDYGAAEKFLENYSIEVNDEYYVDFNDNEKTTHKDVLNFLKKAIGRAKRTGK